MAAIKSTLAVVQKLRMAKAKLMKKMPLASAKRHRHHYRRFRRSHRRHRPHHRCQYRWTRSSSEKSASDDDAPLAESVNESFVSSCSLHVIKFFSTLARVLTPLCSCCPLDNDNLSAQETDQFEFGNHSQDSQPQTETAFTAPRTPVIDDDRFLLPPLDSKKKRTIVLDLDETLVHTSLEPNPEVLYDFIVSPNIEGRTYNLYVQKRPGVDPFLEEISKKYEVVVFTAGLKEYATMALDKLDPKGRLISHRLYRESCRKVDNIYVKDLSQMGRDLAEIVIVDDNPNSYYLHTQNAIPIKPFFDDVKDRELEKLARFLKGCHAFQDMRVAARQYVNLDDAFISESL